VDHGLHFRDVNAGNFQSPRACTAVAVESRVPFCLRALQADNIIRCRAAFCPADGPSNRSKVLLSASLERSRGVDASPFNVLLLHAAVASDMRRAAPSIPILPWIEPGTTSYGGGFSALLPIWSESLFHLSLRSGARRFLWWRAGADKPLSRGMSTASAALHELDTVMSAATAGAWARSGEGCDMTTIAQEELDWTELYLLSGVVVRCPSAEVVMVWRLTFRCDSAQRDNDDVDCAYPTVPGEWHVGGGLIARPVPNGTLLNVSGGVRTGFWFTSC
jgi:hypothetical protein